MPGQRSQSPLRAARVETVSTLRGGLGWVARAMLLTAVLAGCDSPEPSSGLHAEGLDGRQVRLDSGERPVVTLFVDPQCPIANRYAPAIQTIIKEFAGFADFWLVYPNSALSPREIREHVQDFQLPSTPVRDPAHGLVERARIRVTPEAAVFGADGSLIYHGRIDDRFVDFNRQRPVPKQRDLHDVLARMQSGESVARQMTVAAGSAVQALGTPGVGCFVADLR